MIDWLLIFINVALLTAITLGASYIFGTVMFLVTETASWFSNLLGRSYTLHIIGSALPDLPKCPDVLERVSKPLVMPGVEGWQAAMCVMPSVLFGIVFGTLATSSLLGGCGVTEKVSIETITIKSITQINNDDAFATVVVSTGKPRRIEVNCQNGILEDQPKGWMNSWNDVTIKAPVDFRRHLFTDEKPIQIPTLRGLICNV